MDYVRSESEPCGNISAAVMVLYRQPSRVVNFKLTIGQFVIGKFVIGQFFIGQFNKPNTFKDVV